MQPKKQSHQLKALTLKNLKLQSKQPCTNCCQIFTPIICLAFTMVIRDVVIDKIPSNEDNVYNKYPLVPIKFNNYTLADTFLSKQIFRNCTQWYLYEIGESADEEFIGSRDGINNGSGSGLLGQISDTYYKECKFNLSKTSKPFEKLYPPVMKTPNISIEADIYETTKYLNQQNMNDMKKYHNYDLMPDGGIRFHQASPDNLSVNLEVMDIRNLDYYRSDGISKISYFSEKLNKTTNVFSVPEGLLSIQDLISSAFLKQISINTMQSGIMYMPPIQSAPAMADLLINTVSGVLFPISLSLLLPVFLYLIVLQKQQKLIQMMRMNGMKMRNYWFINFLFDLAIGLLTNLVFFVFGTVFLGGAVFQGTGTGVLLVIMFGWILDQIAMATFFQTFITSSRAANIIGYLLAIWTNLIGSTLSIAIYQYPRPQPTYISLFPTFAFDRLFYLILTRCSDDRCYKSLSGLDTEAQNCIIILYISFIFFQLLGMYLFQIVPQQYGVKQKLTFPIDFLFQKYRERKIKAKYQSQSQSQLQQQIVDEQDFKSHLEVTGDLQCKQNNDYLAKNQINRIRKIKNVAAHALIIKRLRKVYENGKEAVRGMDLLVEDRQVFGLLGPNGAGKTTLISMITGIFQPTSGECLVAGYNIKQDIEQVHVNIGVCPQFDILWPQLTVEQHLYFYARLRGIKTSQQKQAVQKALIQVNLQNFKNFKSSQLSGGMKRRLSVGISMVGNPRIVFLDEPTTGLDPENRRNLWQVLNGCRKQRSLFLTTHLMQEADTLCNRIGIITNGVLRTVGTQQQLKKNYGRGYSLSLNVQVCEQELTQKKLNPLIQSFPNSFFSQQEKSESILSQDFMKEQSYLQLHRKKRERLHEKIREIKEEMKRMFPLATIDRQINGYISFRLEDLVVSEALKMLNGCRIVEIRENWGLTNSSLEDVFLGVVKCFGELEQKQSLLTDENVIFSGDTEKQSRYSIQENQ